MSEIILNNYNLFFNTKYRTNGTIDYAQFQLIKPLVLSHPHAFYRLIVTSLALPLSYNMLRAPNNIFYFSYSNPTVYNLSCTITPGNYNITNFLIILASSIASSILSASGDIVTFNFSYNSSTFLSSLLFITASKTITINTTDLNKSLFINTMLGFTSSYLFSSVLTATSNTSINVNPVSCIYLRSDTLGTKNMESLTTSNTFSDVIECFPTGVSFGSYLMSSGETIPTTSRLNNGIIDIISVYLSDNASTISGTDLYDSIPQTLNWSFSLNIQEIVYENQYSDQRHPEQKYIMDNNSKPTEKDALINELKLKKDDLLKQIKSFQRN